MTQSKQRIEGTVPPEAEKPPRGDGTVQTRVTGLSHVNIPATE
jgi:hypothetical protein